MTLAVTHTFVSAIADDPTASAAGEVLPSHWNASHTLTGTVTVAQGGTGLTSYTTGDILYASGASALSALPAVAAGSVLASVGVGTAPTWSTYKPVLVNAQTGTTYTIAVSDLGKLVTFSNAAAIAVTLPTATGSFGSGANLLIENKGAGTVTITPTTSTIDGSATLALTTNQGVELISDGTNWASVRGIGGAGGGTPVGSSGQFQYDNAGAFGGANEWFVSANVIAQANSTTAQARYVYNTVDSVTSPTNYERGVFDWVTSANVLTIGTQKGGTGTARAINLTSANGLSIDLGVTVGGYITLNASGAGVLPSGDASTNFGTGSFRWLNIYFSNIVSTGAASISSPASKVFAIGDGGANANGWTQWAGEARVTADVNNTTTTLATATGLSVALQAGRTYQFEVNLQVTDAAAGGVQAAMVASGGLTATAIQYTGWTVADNAIKAKTNSTALGTVVGSTTTTETAGIVVQIYGTITVNVAGTLNAQFAQNTTNATATTVKRGSYMIVHDMP